MPANTLLLSSIVLIACSLIACDEQSPSTDLDSTVQDGKISHDSSTDGDSGGGGDLNNAEGGISSDGPGGDAFTPKPDAGACVKTGYHGCTAGPCCDTTATCETSSNMCKNGLGGFCSPAVANPDAFCATGLVCNTKTSKCEPLKCIDKKHEGICSSLIGIPCCHPKAVCTKSSPDAGMYMEMCCVPDGTILLNSEVILCCSASSVYVDPKKSKCGPP